MKTNGLTNFINNPSLLAPSVFLAIGSAKTISDVVKAKPNRKKRAFAKDVGILTGSLIGFTLTNLLMKKFCFRTIFKNKYLKKIEFVLRQTIGGTLNTFSGIVGAVYTNEFTHKYFLNNSYFKPKDSNKDLDKKDSSQKKDVFSKFNELKNTAALKTADIMFSTITDLPSMNAFSSPKIALSGFTIANTKGYHNKLKKMTYEILANTLIPTLAVTITSLIIKNKKNSIKYPLLIGSLLIGSLIGNKLATHFKPKLDEAIDDIDMKNIVIK